MVCPRRSCFSFIQISQLGQLFPNATDNNFSIKHDQLSGMIFIVSGKINLRKGAQRTSLSTWSEDSYMAFVRLGRSSHKEITASK